MGSIQLSLLLLVATLALNANVAMANAMTASGTEFNKQAAAFALDLYRTLIKGRENENIIVSPLSLHTALGLVYMGAAGQTKTEMASILRIPDDKEVAADRYRHVLCKYKNSQMLKIANKVYVQQGRKLSTKFIDLSQKNFKSEASNIDFSQNVEAASTINDWVENKTANKIKNLINPSSLNADTRIVLVNAIHFKGQWENKFLTEFTTKQDFWISETESIKVDMMSNNKAHYPYGIFDDLDASAVELPFKGEDLSMLILLPRSKTGLAALEEKLKGQDLVALRKKMHSVEVVVSMPKFQVEFSIEMNDVLTEMGMGTMFSNEADFSELLDVPEPLRVSKVVHKAFIDVNEEGAEAAAATGILMARMCLMICPEMVVDHPFLYYIIDTKNGDIIFNGTVKRF